MEAVAEAKVLIVQMICPKCSGKGLMKRTEIRITDDYLYPHKCDYCGYEDNYKIAYPCQRFVPIEPLREPNINEI